MVDARSAAPLMVKPSEDFLFVEEDNDTVSENEPSSGVHQPEEDPKAVALEHVYVPVPSNERKKNYLTVPKLPLSRSVSSESSDGGTSTLTPIESVKKKSHHHEYEKLSVAASFPKKKISLERMVDGSFFRRRQETHEAKKSEKVDDEEHILEAMRHIVRKCMNTDPLKRPSSNEVIDLLSTFNEKS